MRKRHSYKSDRALKAKIRKTKPYKSRAALQNDRRVSAKVRRFASGLGQFDPLQKQVEDKYFVPAEFPTRDMITELGIWEDKKSLCKLLLLSGALFIGYKYFM